MERRSFYSYLAALIGTPFVFNQGGRKMPLEKDVRSGVTYDRNLVGNLKLPHPSYVLKGVGYGSNGTELVGTHICLPPSGA